MVVATITEYPKKYAHGFVVICFVVVMQSFIMFLYEVSIHIHQGCFAGTGAIVRLPQCQWSKPDGYGKISQCITTTKHSKAKTVCICLGIYCMTTINVTVTTNTTFTTTQIAKFMVPTWGIPGSCRPQMGPCWPNEPCYQGTFSPVFYTHISKSNHSPNLPTLPVISPPRAADNHKIITQFACNKRGLYNTLRVPVQIRDEYLPHVPSRYDSWTHQ